MLTLDINIFQNDCSLSALLCQVFKNTLTPVFITAGNEAEIQCPCCSIADGVNWGNTYKRFIQLWFTALHSK